MTHLMLGKPEKVRLEKYFLDLWNLFHPKLSEPSIPVHPNKQVRGEEGQLIVYVQFISVTCG
jgi:hypothetical protein